MLFGSSACSIERMTSDAMAEFAFEGPHLALPDAMLAGAGPVHAQSPQVQPRDEVFCQRDVLRVVHVHQHRGVVIAVADMADDRRDQPHLGDVGLGSRDASASLCNRYADICGEATRAGPKRSARPSTSCRACHSFVRLATLVHKTVRRHTPPRSRLTFRPARRYACIAAVERLPRPHRQLAGQLSHSARRDRIRPASARGLKEWLSLAQVYSHYTITLGGAGRDTLGLAKVDQALRLSESIGDKVWRARGRNTRGWCLGTLGHTTRPLRRTDAVSRLPPSSARSA